MDEQRNASIRHASLIALFGNTILAAGKIAVGILAQSYAVLGDGFDSATDIIAALVTLVASRIMSKPPDREHPYGHNRADAIAASIVGFIIFFMGAQLILSAIHRIAEDSERALPSAIALYISAVSMAGKLILALVQRKYGKLTGSSMLMANARNMFNDIIISGSVFVGLVFTILLRMPLLDFLVAILIGLWIIRTSISIMLQSGTEVMDSIEDGSVYDIICQAVSTVGGALNPHRIRVRRIGELYVIDLDIEVDGRLSVARGHAIAVQTEARIREALDNVYDIMVHIEPRGNVEVGEKFGISGDTLP